MFRVLHLSSSNRAQQSQAPLPVCSGSFWLWLVKNHCMGHHTRHPESHASSRVTHVSYSESHTSPCVVNKGPRRTVKSILILGRGQLRGRDRRSCGQAQVWQYLEVSPLQVQELGAPDVVPSEDVLILTETEVLQPGSNLLCPPKVNCRRRKSRRAVSASAQHQAGSSEHPRCPRHPSSRHPETAQQPAPTMPQRLALP